MVTYALSNINNQTVTFDVAVDSINTSLNASDLSFTQSTSTDTQVTSSLGSTLLRTTILSSLTAANFTAASGNVFIGDLTSGTTNDSAANTIDFAGNLALVGYLNGNNYANGLAGNDTITAGAGTGNNKFLGGSGNDTIVVGSGNNTIYGGNGTGDSTDGADIITLGSGSNLVYANAGADSITFSSATSLNKSSTIYGGIGADTINGDSAQGNLVLYGEIDNDTISLQNSTGTHTVSGGLGGDIINLTGSTGAVTVFGGTAVTDTADGGDTITGSAGNILIYANAGDDRVTLNSVAGTAANVFLGVGNDSLTSGAVGGTYIIYAGGGADTVDLTGYSGVTTIYGGIGVVDPSDGNDTIIAGTGNTLIYANGGDDSITAAVANAQPMQIYGGAGNDKFNINNLGTSASTTIYDFGNGTDILQTTLTSGSAADIVVTRNSGGTILQGGGGESIVLSGYTGNFSATNLVISGGSRFLTNFNANAASLTGSDFNDQIFAGNNGDTVVAGNGNDRIYGGAGNDTFSFKPLYFNQNDTVSGGAGTDILLMSDNSGPISDAFFANKTSIETLALTGDYTGLPITLANIAGATGINKVDATAATNVTLDAFSLTNAVSIEGGAGTDSITGSVYGDILKGGGGNDTIFGGVGTDTFTGGAGSDTFVYSSNGPFIAQEIGDIITDFDPGTSTTAVDKLRFSAAINTYNLGDNDANVVAAIISDKVPAGTLGTELIILNTVGMDTANIAARLEVMNSLTTAGKGVLDVFYDTTKGHAVVYFDANGSTAGGHTLVANLTSVTSLSDMTKFDFSDFSFTAI